MTKLIDEVRELKKQGLTAEEITVKLSIPVFLAMVLYELCDTLSD